MKFADLYACSKCGLVYAAPMNGGRCVTPIADVAGRIDPCHGIIRPINYKPPTKDPKQRDIEEQLERDRARPEKQEEWSREYQNDFSRKVAVCQHPRTQPLGHTGDASDWVVCLDCGMKWRP